MNIEVRREKPTDVQDIHEGISRAFERREETLLVDRLREEGKALL